MEEQVGRGSKRVFPETSLSNCYGSSLPTRQTARFSPSTRLMAALEQNQRSLIKETGRLDFSRKLPTFGKAWKIKLE